MRDDDEPGSGSGLLWYEVGHGDGYSDGYHRGKTRGYQSGEDDGYHNGEQAALRSFQAQEQARERAGWRTIHINDFNAWMALLDQERHRTAQLANEVESLKHRLAVSDRRCDEYYGKLSKTQDFGRGMQNCLWALLKAAEQGKTNYPEYSELKSIVYQMIDAWGHGEILCKATALGPHIVDLMEALER